MKSGDNDDNATVSTASNVFNFSAQYLDTSSECHNVQNTASDSDDVALQFPKPANTTILYKLSWRFSFQSLLTLLLSISWAAIVLGKYYDINFILLAIKEFHQKKCKKFTLA